MERSRYWSLESVPMFVGMGPLRLFTVRSRRRRFGKEEKSKFWRLPLSPAYARFISVMLPSLLHAIPCHLHGLEAEELVCATHDFRICWSGRLFFHLSRASASVFDLVLALQEDSKTKSASKTCNDSFPWQAICSDLFFCCFHC